jgi:hypothetical protein
VVTELLQRKFSKHNFVTKPGDILTCVVDTSVAEYGAACKGGL